MVINVLSILISLLLLFACVDLTSPHEGIARGMVFVAGGTFRMGTDKGVTDEEPVHRVTLDSFYIGKFEVTQEEWEAVMGSNPSLFKGGCYPVETVSWYGAVEYCNKKSVLEGLTPCYSGNGGDIACNFGADGYRLPTEAEWEYACRGGLKSRHYLYSGSNNPDQAAWHERNSGDRTRPVGRKKPNELEIYDMSGNVWEWCWDWYDKDYYKNSPPDNPKGPLSGKKRSYRGGGGPGGRTMWLRSTGRFSLEPAYKSFDMGFRIVKNLSGKKTGNMVLVKGGIYRMGSTDGGNGEKPAHTVTLRSFYIGRFEVTQEEWCRVMGKNPSFWVGAKSPVEMVSWYDAAAYCNKRSVQEGLTPCYRGNGDDIACNFGADGYRLPTEAEWEYASRGGLKSRHYVYSGSNSPGEVGWSTGNAGFKTEPVGQKKANELEIFDMSGNVWEWCWDWYDREYYKNSPQNSPQGPLSGVRRVSRGGCIYDPEESMQSTYRLALKPNRSSAAFGFRVVRTAVKSRQ
jgi:sulfatase modifying factor 1